MSERDPLAITNPSEIRFPAEGNYDEPALIELVEDSETVISDTAEVEQPVSKEAEQPTEEEPTEQPPGIIEGTLEGLKEDAQVAGGLIAGPIDTVTDFIEWLADPEGELDLQGTLPRIPEFESKTAEALRDVSGLVVPSLGLRGMLIKNATKLHKAKLAAPWLQNLGNKASFEYFAKFGADVGTGGFVDYVARQNQEDHNATGMLKQYWPNTYQWIPNSIATEVHDGPDEKRAKNVAEGGIFNVFSSIVEGSAHLLKANKSLNNLGKFIPKNENAVKNLEKLTKDEFSDVVFSKENPIEDTVLRNEARKQKELENLGTYLSGRYPNQSEQLEFFTQNELLTRTKDPDGIIGATVDKAMIDNNIDTTYGRLGSIVTESSLKNGLQADNLAKRTLIKGLVEEIKMGGKYAKKLANGKVITEAMIEESGNKIAETLLDPRMDTGDMRELLGNFKRSIEETDIQVVGKKGYRGVTKAIAGLKDQLLDMDVQKARAYLVTSLSGQTADIAEGVRLMEDSFAMHRAIDEIADRLEYLLVEKGLAAYEAGSTLSSMNTWKAAKKTKDAKIMQATAETLTNEVNERLLSIMPSAKNFANTVRELAQENPHFTKSLLLANEFTDGNVDSMYKLNTYISNKLGTLNKAIVDLNPEVPSIINRAWWSNVYNSVLSAFATPAKALAGNVGGLIARPTATIAGAALDGDWHIVKRALTSNFALDDTLTKSLQHMSLVFKKASLDPTSVSYIMREDIALKNEQSLDLLHEYASAASKEGEDGPLALLNIYENLEALAEDPVLRFGANSMTALDGFSRAVIGNAEAKARAFDILTKQGKEINAQTIREVSDNIYKEMFDSNGMITDKAVDYINSEIALNLDSDLVKGLNTLLARYPVIKPFFLFPRTSANILETMGKYSPGGIFAREYQDLWGPFGRRKLNSFSLDEIRGILEKRGIPFDEQALVNFRQIRAEVKGKVALGTIMTTAASWATLNGRVRGNGHYDRSRQRVRRAVGWKPKTIQGLDGKWYSYEWLGPLGDWLSVVADAGDNFDLVSSSQQEEILQKLTFIFGSAITNRSVLSNVEPLNDILQGNGAAFNRWAASFGNALLPLSGQRNELGRVLNPQLREIKSELNDLWRNRNNWLDVVNPEGSLPGMFDFIDGKPVGYPENFFVRAWNAYSPMKQYDGLSPERQFLVDIEFNMMPHVNVSSGGVELTNRERSLILSKIGEQGWFKKDLQRIIRDAKSFEYEGTKGMIPILKKMRSGGISSEVLETEKYKRIYSRIRRAFNSAKLKAEGSLDPVDRADLRFREINQSRRDVDTERGRIDELLIPGR